MLQNIFNRIKSFFFGEKTPYRAEPIVYTNDIDTQYPVIVVAVGKNKIKLSNEQARSLWGKLGKHLEKITPDKL